MLTVEITEPERKMVMRALANMVATLKHYPYESALDEPPPKWVKLMNKFGTAEEFKPLLCPYKATCPHTMRPQLGAKQRV